MNFEFQLLSTSLIDETMPSNSSFRTSDIMEAFTGDEGRSPLSTLRHKGVCVTGSVIAKIVDQLGQPGERGEAVWQEDMPILRLAMTWSPALAR